MNTPDLPFLDLAKMLRATEADRPEYSAPVVPATGREVASDTQTAFEASLKGVQTGFSHLETADIAHPPHNWMDAFLARQIAIHIAVRRLNMPVQEIARELPQVRRAFHKAISTVDQRMRTDQFAESYERMAKAAEEKLQGGDK